MLQLRNQSCHIHYYHSIIIQIDRVIFVVFLKVDYRLYTALMHHYFPLELVTIQDPSCKSTEGEKEKNMKDKPVIPSLQKTVSEPGK